jgi:hypothetical protein
MVQCPGSDAVALTDGGWETNATETFVFLVNSARSPGSVSSWSFDFAVEGSPMEGEVITATAICFEPPVVEN